MTNDKPLDPRVYDILQRLCDIGAYVQSPHIIVRRHEDEIGALVDTIERIINRVEPEALHDLESAKSPSYAWDVGNAG